MANTYDNALKRAGVGAGTGLGGGAAVRRLVMKTRWPRRRRRVDAWLRNPGRGGAAPAAGRGAGSEGEGDARVSHAPETVKRPGEDDA